MVDYHDPDTIAEEFSTYAFPSGSENRSLIYRFVFNSGGREALARREWHIHVSLPR
jgi:hypothetical protein